MAAKNPLNLPTERIDLPSRGLIYPDKHVLRQGFVDILPPGARQEDILTNANYLAKGTAADKFLESIIVTDVVLDDMIPGDRDAIMIAARVLGFGKNYTTTLVVAGRAEVVTFDLTTFKEREVQWTEEVSGTGFICPNGTAFIPSVNEFSYQIEGGSNVKFKLLTGFDQIELKQEEDGIRKTSPDYSADTSLFLKFALTEVDGSRSTADIRKFVDNPQKLPLYQIKDLKRYITSVSPGYIWNSTGTLKNKEKVEDLFVPYTVDFFWPR